MSLQAGPNGLCGVKSPSKGVRTDYKQPNGLVYSNNIFFLFLYFFIIKYLSFMWWQKTSALHEKPETEHT